MRHGVVGVGRRRWLRNLVVAGIAASSLAGFVTVGAASGQSASPSGPSAEQPAARSGDGGAPDATVVTAANESASATSAPSASAQPSARHQDEAAYEAAKAKSDAAAKTAKTGGPTTSATAPSASGPATTIQRNFNGVAEDCAGCLFPPDTNGAVGLTQYVEATNDHITVYPKTAGTGSCVDPSACFTKNTTLKTFFGTTEFVFDPRVLFDPTWNRWVIVATRAASSSTDTLRQYFLAVSTTQDAAGSYFVYHVGWTLNGVTQGAWMDFPMLGMDQDAIIISGNFFQHHADNSDSFFAGAVHSIAKARVYNGFGFGFSFFVVGFSTQPPVQAGIPSNNLPTDFLASSDGAGKIHLWKMTNAALSNVNVVAVPDVSIAAFGAPPSAGQPGTTVKLDTGDGRISSHTVEVGGSLFLTFVTNDFGFSTPRFYEITTSNSTVKQTAQFFASSSSFDFNSSLAVNSSKDVFLTWSSTDPTNSVNAQVRSGGRKGTDTLNTLANGATLFTSPTFYTGGPIFNSSGTFTGVDRWGDYSGFELDPVGVSGCAAGKRAYLTNQKQNVSNTWSTRAASMGFC